MNKLYKYKNGKRIKVLKDRKCPVCKISFSPKTSKDIYCSRECYYEMKRIRGDKIIWTDEMKKNMSKKYKGKGNPMYGKKGWSKDKKRPEITGEKSKLWKGGYWISKDGYKIIENEIETKGKKVLEHRMIMEIYLGRKLKIDEIIHHKNENKLDNRIKNLQIVSRAEHINLHRKDLRRNQQKKPLNG